MPLVLFEYCDHASASIRIIQITRATPTTSFVQSINPQKLHAPIFTRRVVIEHSHALPFCDQQQFRCHPVRGFVKCAKRIDAFESLSGRALRFIKSSNPFISFLYVLFVSGTTKYCFPSAYRPSGHLKWVLGNPEFLSAFEGFPVGASKTNAA